MLDICLISYNPGLGWADARRISGSLEKSPTELSLLSCLHFVCSPLMVPSTA